MSRLLKSGETSPSPIGVDVVLHMPGNAAPRTIGATDQGTTVHSFSFSSVNIISSHLISSQISLLINVIPIPFHLRKLQFREYYIF